MSDDGPVPAVDPRAANDPLLRRVVELAKKLHDVWWWLLIIANPEACPLDESQWVQIHDWKDEQLPHALLRTRELQDDFSPKAYGLSNYPPDLPAQLHWLLGEAKKLLEQEAEATGEELVKLAADFGRVKERIMLAGTDPPAACRAPKLPGYERHERERVQKLNQEFERQKSEWPQYSYQSSFDRMEKRESLASLGIVPDSTPISSEDEITAEFRCGGVTEGEPLYVDFVSIPEQYNLSGSYLAKHYKGPRLKLGRKLIYRHVEITALSDKKGRRQPG